MRIRLACLWRLAIVAVIITALFNASSRLPVRSVGEPIKVSVGIPPLAYIVERVGGPYVSVSTLLISGQDPHTFEPSPRQVASLAGADIYFSLDLPFEQRMLGKVQNQDSGLAIVSVAGIGREIHDEEHSHEDPHVWLSLKHLERMALEIAGTLTVRDTAHSAEYEQYLEKLCLEIQQLDAAIRQRLQPFAGREFLTYHSSLGHFAAEYGLIEVSIEVEGKSPGARALANIITWAKSNGIRTVFVQPQFDDSSARLIAESIGASIVSIDPLKKDVLANLWAIADQLAQSME